MCRVNLPGDLANFPFADNRSGKFLIALKVNDGTLELPARVAAYRGSRRRPEIRRRADDDRRGARRIRWAHILGRPKPRSPNLGAAHPVLTVVGDCDRADIGIPAIHRAESGGRLDRPRNRRRVGNRQRQARAQADAAAGQGRRIEGRGRIPVHRQRVALPERAGAGSGQWPIWRSRSRTCARRTWRSRRWAARRKWRISSADGRVRVAGSGTANLAALRNEFDVPMLDHVSGSTDWQVSLDIGSQRVVVVAFEFHEGCRRRPARADRQVRCRCRTAENRTRDKCRAVRTRIW